MNKINYIRDSELEKVKQHAVRRLSSLTKNGEKNIFFVNALQALEAKESGDNGLYYQSGVGMFEEKTKQYLLEMRAMLKISVPAKKLNNLSKDILEYAKKEENMVQNTYAELLQKYVEAEPARKTVISKADNVKSNINQMIIDVINSLENKLRELAEETVQSLPEAMKSYDTSNMDLTLKHVLKMRSKVEEASKVVVNDLLELFKTKLKTKIDKTLIPYMAGELKKFEDKLEVQLEGFYISLDEYKLSFDTEAPSEVKNVSAFERIAATIGGFLLADVGAAMVGGMFGVKQMLFAIIPAIVITFSLAFLGILNPITLIPLLLSAGFLQGILKCESIKDKIVEKLMHEFQSKWNSELRNNLINDVTTKVKKKLETSAEPIKKGLDIEIEKTEQQIKQALQNLKEGQSRIEQVKREIDQVKTGFAEINSDLVSLFTG